MWKRDYAVSASGFTLIELLIVVAIIGIIGAIAIPNLLNAIDRGKKTRTLADMRTISNFVEQFSIDNSHYPQVSTIDELKVLVEDAAITNAMPVEDAWNGPLFYTSDGFEYTIASCGKGATVCNSLTFTGEWDKMADDLIIHNGMVVQGE